MALSFAPKIYLAPMEGLVDFLMRDLLTRYGGYDFCTTEFLRVTQTVYPSAVFEKHCPEYETNFHTPSGVPVIFQLLGSDLVTMAQNAQRLEAHGVRTIDINFGCPSPTVNRHNGGATLLKTPTAIYDVVKAVRESVSESVMVTAKMRLGYEDKSGAVQIARLIEKAGAQRLTVHARTKLEGYRPPAHWHEIKPIREALSIEVVANGEVWNAKQAAQCLHESRCTSLMLGRGGVSDPCLATQIKRLATHADDDAKSELRFYQFLLLHLNESMRLKNEGYAVRRSKQWLKTALAHHQFLAPFFDEIRQFDQVEPFIAKVETKIKTLC